MFLKSFLRRRKKILRGLLATRFRGQTQPYAAESWWDEGFYTDGVSDRQTIGPAKNAHTAAYHYASVELLILRQLCRLEWNATGTEVCDFGSGSGHWIDFYLRLGAARCAGIDISTKACEFLRRRFAAHPGVTIHQHTPRGLLTGSAGTFHLVNAIGFMFHLVDDAEWAATVAAAGCALKPGGLFIVSGHFGWLNHVNVQVGRDGLVNKRLRSHACWRRTLRQAGLEEVGFHRNPAYLFIRDSLPENNLLVARKPSSAAKPR